MDTITYTFLNKKIKNLAESAGLKREIVISLPAPSEATENKIYMVKDETAQEGNIYKEYMLINGIWELIGDTSVEDKKVFVNEITKDNNPINFNLVLTDITNANTETYASNFIHGTVQYFDDGTKCGGLSVRNGNKSYLSLDGFSNNFEQENFDEQKNKRLISTLGNLSSSSSNREDLRLTQGLIFSHRDMTTQEVKNSVIIEAESYYDNAKDKYINEPLINLRGENDDFKIGALITPTSIGILQQGNTFNPNTMIYSDGLRINTAGTGTVTINPHGMSNSYQMYTSKYLDSGITLKNDSTFSEASLVANKLALKENENKIELEPTFLNFMAYHASSILNAGYLQFNGNGSLSSELNISGLTVTSANYTATINGSDVQLIDSANDKTISLKELNNKIETLENGISELLDKILGGSSDTEMGAYTLNTSFNNSEFGEEITGKFIKEENE